MENNENNVLIINRKRKYNVYKPLLLTVPYFEKMFASDCSESKEKKVELDFDEHVFDAILDWILSGSFFIRMDYVISFYEAADYLMINENLLEPCLSYFRENLTIEHLPVVLPQVTKVSKISTSESINNIICRHFLMIANTDIFLDYPVETVKAILKLNLMVYSEYQVFESIMKWVNKNEKSRKDSLSQLLNCVRWSFMDTGDISKIKDELIVELPNFDEIISSSGERGFNRSDQSFFISIHQKADTTLLIKVYDSDFFSLSIGDFTQDDSMSLEFVYEDHISDILLDSGTKGIRIDWFKKTFRWLDFKVAGKTYYSNLIKFIVKFSSDLNHLWCYLEDEDEDLSGTISSEEQVLLEANGEFILIGKTKTEKKWFGLFPVRGHSWFHDFKDHKHSFQATVLDNNVYILTKDLEFIQYNYETECFRKNDELTKEKFKFNDLILTSHKKNAEVILVNKASGKVYVFCAAEKKWIEKFRIMNIKLYTVSDINKLVAFTSTFLPMQCIEPLYYDHSEDSM